MPLPSVRPVLHPGAGFAQSSARRPPPPEEQEVESLDPGYEEVEFFVSGHASTYVGPATEPATVATTGHAFTTRVLVRGPLDPARASGRVVIEPFNTSAGFDRDVLWRHVGGLLQEQGDSWVGVTTRAASVTGLRNFDSVRYADLDLESNDFGWDVLGYVGASVRLEGSLLPSGVKASQVYLGGYSQSAADVATFAMAFHDSAGSSDQAPPFDGYFPAGHSGTLTLPALGDRFIPAFEASPILQPGAPMVDVETQSDVEGFEATLRSGRTYTSTGGAHVRQSDLDPPSGYYRLFELAGAPHAARMEGCDGGGSSFPTSAYLRCALSHLFAWAETGVAPPSAPRLELDRAGPVSVCAVDEFGNAVGGIRSPHLDVPLARYEAHSGPGALCALVGREVTLSPEHLNRYGSFEDYMDQFAAALDETIGAGFILERDRAELLAAHTVRAKQAFAQSA